MGKRKQQRVLLVALVGLWGACLFSHDGIAAPPLNKMAAQLARTATAVSAAPQAVKLPASRLDLALPSSTGPDRSAAEWPMRGRGSWTWDSLKTSMPTLGLKGSDTTPERIMSRPEMLARNFKRDGLPVARLFQTENSLVHIGLSPKGKPGLWIIEKLH